MNQEIDIKDDVDIERGMNAAKNPAVVVLESGGEGKSLSQKDDSLITQSGAAPPSRDLDVEASNDPLGNTVYLGDLEEGVNQEIDMNDDATAKKSAAPIPKASSVEDGSVQNDEQPRPWWKKRQTCIFLVLLILLTVAIALGVSLGRSNKSTDFDENIETDLIVPSSSKIPSVQPSSSQSLSPNHSAAPSSSPSLTSQPSSSPSSQPSAALSALPSASTFPSQAATPEPTDSPSKSPVTLEPTSSPSNSLATPELTSMPTKRPAVAPSTSTSPSQTMTINETPNPTSVNQPQDITGSPTAKQDTPSNGTSSPKPEASASNQTLSLSPTFSPSSAPTVDCSVFTKKKPCLRPRKQACFWDNENKICSRAELI